MIKAVIDRIEENEWAVILAEKEGLEFKIPIEKLPETVEEGTWLNLEIEDGEIVSLEIDREETQKRRERIGKKLEKLRERESKSSKRLK